MDLFCSGLRVKVSFFPGEIFSLSFPSSQPTSNFLIVMFLNERIGVTREGEEERGGATTQLPLARRRRNHRSVDRSLPPSRSSPIQREREMRHLLLSPSPIDRWNHFIIIFLCFVVRAFTDDMHHTDDYHTGQKTMANAILPHVLMLACSSFFFLPSFLLPNFSSSSSYLTLATFRLCLSRRQ